MDSLPGGPISLYGGVGSALDKEEAAGHDLINGELLMRDADRRQEMLGAYRLMSQIFDMLLDEVVGIRKRQ